MSEEVRRPLWQRLLIRTAGYLRIPLVYGHCLALYGRDTSAWNLQSCFDTVSREFDFFGVRADLVAFGKDDKKMLSLEKGLERLKRRGWRGVDDFSIKASRWGGGFITGWYVSTECFPEGGYFFFCVSSDLARADNNYFISLARRLYDSVNFDYGIVYSRRFDLGADLYAVGLIAGLDYSKEAQVQAHEIGKWMNAYHYFEEQNDSRAHHLRDVYEVNFVSPVHLARLVDGQPLRDWIAASPHRGALRPFAGDRLVWKIESANIPAVRERLIANSLLVAYRKDVPPLD